VPTRALTGDEAEREHDRQFHSTELCGARADAATGVQCVLAVGHLRSNRSVRGQHLDSENRRRHQDGDCQPNERGSHVAHAPTLRPTGTQTLTKVDSGRLL
jgi:hypothetical protein